jgi:hypothetical protein
VTKISAKAGPTGRDFDDRSNTTSIFWSKRNNLIIMFALIYQSTLICQARERYQRNLLDHAAEPTHVFPLRDLLWNLLDDQRWVRFLSFANLQTLQEEYFRIPPDFEHFSKYATYIFAFILQVWTYSFAGDQVIYWVHLKFFHFFLKGFTYHLQSSKIPDEIFYNWNGDNLTIDGSNRIIAIKRGQKAARVSLGGFGNLDIESFKFVTAERYFQRQILLMHF